MPERRQTKYMEKKSSKMSKLYFWLFVLLAILGAFLLWSAREDAFINAETNKINASYLGAIAAIALSLMFGIFTFVRFIRNRSVAGGLFLTTAISTGIFLGTSQIVAAVVPPTAAAFSGDPAATANTYTTVVGLAQIGLFALWFLFLLLTIYIQVSPVKKIDKVLTKIIDGDDIRRVKIGKSKQYKVIEAKLQTLSTATQEKRKKDEQKRKNTQKQRERAKIRREEREKKLREFEAEQMRREARV
jgi:hypothetical protein